MLLGQGDGQAAAGVWAAIAQTHAALALAPPPRSAHPVQITAHGPPPGPASDPAMVIIDASPLARS